MARHPSRGPIGGCVHSLKRSHGCPGARSINLWGVAGQWASSKVATTAKKQERVIVRFAGDSGDGMQLVGARFTAATALVGNDLSTLPDFPAEIRAPAGTPHGVSAFQIHFASRDILTPGDYPNTLVAMNPAALAAHLAALEPGGTLIVNEDAFTEGQPRQGRLRGEPARRRHRSTATRSSRSR